jgi:hypothetical protein
MEASMAVRELDHDAAAPPAPGGRRLPIALTVAVGAGVLALPLWWVGVGWPICALALLGVALAARSARPATGGADRAWRIAAGAAALVLATVPAVRASVPLAALCVLTALLLTAYSLVGGRTWAELLASSGSLVPAAVLGLGWTASGTASRVPRAGRIALGTVVGAGLVLVFGALLRGADPVFADLIDQWIGGISPAELVRAGLGGIAVGWLGIALAYRIRNRVERDPAGPTPPRRTLHGAEWVIPVALLFAVFVLVQLTVLFGGNAYVLGAGGPDYADYARGGFVQLGVVTVLTLAVVAGVAALVRRESTIDLGLIRVFGGVLCGLTLVIVASALKRLGLYATAYGFTWPRLLGFAGEVWLGLIFVLILVAGVRLRAGWLPRATGAAAVGVLLALVAVNPEALMARTALARYDTVYPVDMRFIRNLSTDALAGLDRMPLGHDRDCVLDAYARQLREPDPWYAWNLSRAQARAALAKPTRHC